MVTTGLERLTQHEKLAEALKGNVGLLCHSASIDREYKLAVFHLQKILGNRLTKLFGPQHGLVSDVQDNMVESKHFDHPFFKLPVYSLYSETRIPTDEMLEGLDTIVVDLQDVGTRVYTYINTMTMLMEACGKKDIRVVVLDRPNPVGGHMVEGNILQAGFTSFVGRHPIPMRHALTIGEMALYAQKFHGSDCDLVVIPMEGWKREMFFSDTGQPWVLPSPNLPTSDGAIVFCGSVLYEGTNVSEGRGTTRSLEVLGHPDIEPYSWFEELKPLMQDWGFEGFILRPLVFMPTFQKHAGTPCGGFQIHVTDPNKFLSWRLGQFLLAQFKRKLGDKFKWNTEEYEYQADRPAIDFINGTDELRKWVENDSSLSGLEKIEKNGHQQYLDQIKQIYLYQ